MMLLQVLKLVICVRIQLWLFVPRSANLFGDVMLVDPPVRIRRRRRYHNQLCENVAAVTWSGVARSPELGCTIV